MTSIHYLGLSSQVCSLQIHILNLIDLVNWSKDDVESAYSYFVNIVDIDIDSLDLFDLACISNYIVSTH